MQVVCYSDCKQGNHTIYVKVFYLQILHLMATAEPVITVKPIYNAHRIAGLLKKVILL